MAIFSPILLLTATLAALQAGTPPEREPSATLEQRIRDLRAALRDDHDAAIIESANALGELGPEAAAAIPWLFEGLNHSNSWIRDETPAIVQALRRIGPRACLELPDAGRWLAWNGWDPAVPLAATAAELLELTEHPVEEVRELAARELARLHPAAVENVLSRLTGDDLDRRVHAAAAAGAFRADADALIAPLVRCLEARDPRLRFQASKSLGRLLPASATAVLVACGRSDPRVRRAALLALERTLDARRAVNPLPESDVGGCYGLGAPWTWPLDEFLGRKASLDALTARLADPVAENRVLALMVLAKLGAATPAGIAAIQRCTQAEDARVRLWAEHVLRRIAPRPWDVLQVLRERAVDPYSEPAQRALEQLVADMESGQTLERVSGGFGWEFAHPGARDARYEAAFELVQRCLPDLIERARLGDDGAAAILTLAQEVVEGHVRTLVEVANKWREDEASARLVAVGPAASRQVAAAWLGGFWMFCGGWEEVVLDQLGPVLFRLGKCAVPVLTFGLEHDEYFVRCALFLTRIEGSAAPAAAALTRALRVPRRMGVEGWYGADWESVPGHIYLEWGFEHCEKNPEGLDWLAIVCKRMGSGLIPGLLAALADEHAIVRARACRGLAALEVASAEVVAALAAALADDQAHVRFAAARALERLLSPDADLLRQSAAILATFGERP